MSWIPESESAVEVFYSYADQDEQLQKRLEKHFAPLTLQGLIKNWYKRKVMAGQELANEVDIHLTTAHVILLLISPDFMASEYCWGVEMRRAMERHYMGEAYVIPIILRPTDWKEAPFGKLQALPTNARSIGESPNRDRAYLNVVQGIRTVVEEVAAKIAKEQVDLARAELARKQEEVDLARAELARKQEEANLTAREEAAKRESADSVARRLEELTTKVSDAKRAAKEAAELAARAEEELGTAQVEAELAAEREAELAANAAGPKTVSDESKTFWQFVSELLKKRYSPDILDLMERAAQRSMELGQDYIDSLVYFEVSLQTPTNAFVQALKRLHAPVEEIVAHVIRKNETQQNMVARNISKEQLGLSKSILEILVFAQFLARLSGRKQANDTDILETFVLHKKNSAVQMLAKMQIEPELLLSGAFWEDGELVKERFSLAGHDIINNVLQLAQKTRLVGSAQILAALVEERDSLARKMLQKMGYNPDSYVQKNLEKATVYYNLSKPMTLNLRACSSNAMRILNLAELFARLDKARVGEKHLFMAYMQCIKGSYT